MSLKLNLGFLRLIFDTIREVKSHLEPVCFINISGSLGSWSVFFFCLFFWGGRGL